MRTTLGTGLASAATLPALAGCGQRTTSHPPAMGAARVGAPGPIWLSTTDVAHGSPFAGPLRSQLAADGPLWQAPVFANAYGAGGRARPSSCAHCAGAPSLAATASSSAAVSPLDTRLDGLQWQVGDRCGHPVAVQSVGGWTSARWLCPNPYVPGLPMTRATCRKLPRGFRPCGR